MVQNWNPSLCSSWFGHGRVTLRTGAHSLPLKCEMCQKAFSEPCMHWNVCGHGHLGLYEPHCDHFECGAVIVMCLILVWYTFRLLLLKEFGIWVAWLSSISCINAFLHMCTVISLYACAVMFVLDGLVLGMQRAVFLKTLDCFWRDHLINMNRLSSAVTLASYC